MDLFSQSQSHSLNNVGNGASVSLNLKKFSYVSTASLQGRFQWTHLSQPGLRAVFECVAIADATTWSKKLVLMISNAGGVLEQIILDDLLFQARLDEERMKTQQVPESARIVFIITKKPLLAVRYQLADKQIRRIQLNFMPEDGFDTAVRYFVECGLPMQDRGGTAQSHGKGQGPLHNVVATKSQCLPLPTIVTAGAGITRQSSGILGLPPAMSASTLAATRIEEDVNIIRPVSNSSAQQQQQQQISDMHYHSQHPTYYGPARTTCLTSQTVPVAAQELIFGPYLPQVGTVQLSQRPQVPEHDPVRKTLFESRQEEQRPFTAPVSYDEAKKMLPPPRVLPFLAPKRKKKEVADEVQDNSSVKTIPPRPSTTGSGAANKSTTTAKKKQVAQPRKVPKVDFTPARCDPTGGVTIFSDKTGNPCLAGDPTLKTKDVEMTGAAKGSTVATGVQSKHRSVSRMQTVSSHTSSDVQTSALPHNEHTDTSVAPSASDSIPDVAEEWQAAVEAFVTKYKDGPSVPKAKNTSSAAAAVSDLGEYASRPKEERRAAIDDMIVELIMDPHFATLCEDVEAAWKRTGLPM